MIRHERRLGIDRAPPPDSATLASPEPGWRLAVQFEADRTLDWSQRPRTATRPCVLGPGELLGEFESIDEDGGPRTADNVALEDVECRVIRGVEFRAFLESHPRAAMVLLGAYVRRIRHSDRRRADVVAFDTNHRVARLLLERVSKRDVGDENGIDVDLPLTQEELAGLAAASRESVVRALTSLRSRGLITTARRRITVRDVDGLRKYAG